METPDFESVESPYPLRCQQDGGNPYYMIMSQLSRSPRRLQDDRNLDFPLQWRSLIFLAGWWKSLFSSKTSHMNGSKTQVCKHATGIQVFPYVRKPK